MEKLTPRKRLQRLHTPPSPIIVSVITSLTTSTTTPILPPRNLRRNFKSSIETFKWIAEEVEKSLTLTPKYCLRRLSERLAGLIDGLQRQFGIIEITSKGVGIGIGKGKDSVFKLQSFLEVVVTFLSIKQDRLWLLVQGMEELRASVAELSAKIKGLITFYELSISTEDWETEDAIDLKRDDHELPRLFNLSISLRGETFDLFTKSTESDRKPSSDNRRQEFINWCLVKNPALSHSSGELSSPPISPSFDLSDTRRNSQIALVTPEKVEEVIEEIEAPIKIEVVAEKELVLVQDESVVPEELIVLEKEEVLSPFEEPTIEESAIAKEDVLEATTSPPITDEPVIESIEVTTSPPVKKPERISIPNPSLSSFAKHSSVGSIDTPPLTPLVALFPTPPSISPFTFELSPPTKSNLPQLLPALSVSSPISSPATSPIKSMFPHEEGVKSRKRDSAKSIGSLRSIVEEETDDDRNWKDQPVYVAPPLTGLALKLSNIERRRVALQIKTAINEEAKNKMEAEMSARKRVEEEEEMKLVNLKIERPETPPPPLPPKAIHILPPSPLRVRPRPRFPSSPPPFSLPPLPSLIPSPSSSSSSLDGLSWSPSSSRSANTTPNSSPKELSHPLLEISPSKSSHSTLTATPFPINIKPSTTPPPRYPKSLLRNKSSTEMKMVINRPPLRLLSLEGEMQPLQILLALKSFLNSEEKPGDYFDAILSKGENSALIAILLGKLKMRLGEAEGLVRKLEFFVEKGLAEERRERKWVGLLKKFDRVLTGSNGGNGSGDAGEERRVLREMMVKKFIQDETFFDEGWLSGGCVTAVDIAGAKFNSSQSLPTTLHQIFSIDSSNAIVSTLAIIDPSLAAYKQSIKIFSNSEIGEIVCVGFGSGSRELMNMGRRGHFRLERICL